MSSCINVIKLEKEGGAILFEQKNPLNAYQTTELHPTELKELANIHHENRKIEFLGVRKLKSSTHLATPIRYLPSHKPYVDAAYHTHISISHSKKYCAFAYSDVEIGLDIEEISERIISIQSKFLSEIEKVMVKDQQLADLTKFWCMKEAMFKLNDRSGIDFKTELRIMAQNKNDYFGEMLTLNGWRKVRMSCFTHDQLIIAYCKYLETTH